MIATTPPQTNNMSLLKAASIAAGPVSGIVGSLIQNRANRKAQDRAYDRNKEMWNLQNQYNSPGEQMKRLKDAGLNPNLAYGSGKVAGNTTGELPKYQAPRKEMSIPPPDVGGTLNQFSDLRIKDTSKDKMEAEIKNIEQDTVNKGFDAITKKMAGLISGQTHKRMVNTYADYITQQSADAMLAQNNANASNLLETIKEIEIAQARQNLKYGKTRFQFVPKQLEELSQKIRASKLKNEYQVYVNALAKEGKFPGDKIQWRTLSDYLNNPNKLLTDSLNSPLGKTLFPKGGKGYSPKWTSGHEYNWKTFQKAQKSYPSIFNTRDYYR